MIEERLRALFVRKITRRDNFLRWLLAQETDECRTWPFGRDRDGYARTTYVGGRSASRMVCELAHGPAPSNQHQAAHSCGKGQDACVNHRHVRWATPQENMDEQVVHGTRLRGSECFPHRLTEGDVLAIRALKGSTSQKKIAAQFNISQSTVGEIHQGKIWGWLKSDPHRAAERGKK